MEVLRLYASSINERFIDEAVAVLQDGGVVIYPTDSVYALGCDALNRRAVERLCKIKDLNPEKNLLSILCADVSQASEYVKIDNRAFQILKSYLPGPYTFVLPTGTRLPKVLKGRHTVGVRVADNPIATTLASALGNPLLTTSIEINEEDPSLATDAEALALAYGDKVNLILDGGTGDTRLTTVVDLSDSFAPELIRQGKGVWND